MNENWPRWIFASVTKHFADVAANAIDKDGVTPKPIPFYIEGNDRETENQLEYFECRLDGPYFQEVSKDWWRVNIEVNILICCKRQDADFHRIHYLCGLIAKAFTTNIEIRKYGSGIQDDGEILFCLTLVANQGENIVIRLLGQLSPDLKEAQAMVEAYYQGVIDL